MVIFHFKSPVHVCVFVLHIVLRQIYVTRENINVIFICYFLSDIDARQNASDVPSSTSSFISRISRLASSKIFG